MRRICYLFLVVLVVACSKSDRLDFTTLSVSICNGSEVVESEFPIQVHIRASSSDALLDSSSLDYIGQTVVFTLPQWQSYRVSLTTQSGTTASIETSLRDQPVALYMLITAGCRDAGEDTINISLDDTAQNHQSTMPAVLSMYDGHVIVFADSISPDSARLTLLSLSDWSGIHSANNTDYSTEAVDIAGNYQEGSDADWRIPTEEESRRLKSAYNSETADFERLNTLLEQHSGSSIMLTTGCSNVRYLCQEAQKTYSFVSGTNVTTAGAKTDNYHLRLISTITISVRQ